VSERAHCVGNPRCNFAPLPGSDRCAVHGPPEVVRAEQSRRGKLAAEKLRRGAADAEAIAKPQRIPLGTDRQLLATVEQALAEVRACKGETLAKANATIRLVALALDIRTRRVDQAAREVAEVAGQLRGPLKAV